MDNNTIEMKKRYFTNYEALLLEKQELKEKEDTLRSSIENAKAIKYSGMPHASNGIHRDLSDYVAKMDSYFTRILHIEHEMRLIRRDYKKRFSGLRSKEAAVMRMRYLEMKDWKTIANQLKRSRAQVNKYHIAALQKLDINEQNISS